MHTNITLSYMVLVASMFLAMTGAQAEVVVVVSAKSTATALTAEQAADIFLGRSTTLPGASEVIPVDQPEGVPARDIFYQKITGKNPAQVKAYWSKLIFSGKGKPPKDAGSDAGVKTMLAANPNLIGYIDNSALDNSVKVLLTVK